MLESKVEAVFEHQRRGLETLGSGFSGEKCKILGKKYPSNKVNAG